MNDSSESVAAAEVFEMDHIEGRIEFGMYDWIGDHCSAQVTSEPATCAW